MVHVKKKKIKQNKTKQKKPQQLLKCESNAFLCEIRPFLILFLLPPKERKFWTPATLQYFLLRGQKVRRTLSYWSPNLGALLRLLLSVNKGGDPHVNSTWPVYKTNSHSALC